MIIAGFDRKMCSRCGNPMLVPASVPGYSWSYGEKKPEYICEECKKKQNDADQKDSKKFLNRGKKNKTQKEGSV